MKLAFEVDGSREKKLPAEVWVLSSIKQLRPAGPDILEEKKLEMDPLG